MNLRFIMKKYGIFDPNSTSKWTWIHFIAYSIKTLTFMIFFIIITIHIMPPGMHVAETQDPV
jgi:hypothetical protein